MEREFTFQTKLLHNKWKIDDKTGAVSVPVYHASTFHQHDLDSFGRYDYARSGNPTREALEETIALLEGGRARVCLFFRHGGHSYRFFASF